jgi:hypothetical protein
MKEALLQTIRNSVIGADEGILGPFGVRYDIITIELLIKERTILLHIQYPMTNSIGMMM